MNSVTEPQPLSGLRVLDLGASFATAACARLLRGFGAEVTWIETDGDQCLTRDEETFFRHGTHTADLSDLDELIGVADIVLDGRAPGWLSAHGADPVELRASRPGLVITSITPFGQTGPQSQWQTTNAVQFAVGGIMSLTGEPTRAPLVTGGQQALFLGGLQGFAATVTALVGQIRSGRGEWIDISMQEAAASMLELYGAMSEYELGAAVPRAANSVRSTWGVYPCADGWAGVCCLERQVPSLFRLIGEGVAGNPDFTDPVTRRDHDDELLAHVMGFMLDHTKDELLELSPIHRVPFGAVRTPLELLDDAAFNERGFFDAIDTPEGPVTMPGRPFPGLGWAGPGESVSDHSPDETVWPEPESQSHLNRPMVGLRVLDLTMMWAGPYATKLMAECGAEVIKIESPNAWDNIRTLVPQDPSVADPWNSAYYFNEYNHSKKSLTLDLATHQGKELLLQFVADADVVIENYRADVLDKLGLGYEVLKQANENIVLVSMGGFGKTGALSSHVGFGPIIEMMSGLMSLSGYGGEDVPYKTGVSYGDPVGGLHAVAATCLSLIQLARTRTGRHIDMAQSETAASMAGPAFVAASRGELPVPTGNRSPGIAPQGCYPASGAGEWVVISVRSDAEWAEVCQLIGRADLSELSLDERTTRHDELDVLLTAWTGGRSAAATAELLQGLGVPAGPVLDTLAIHDDAHLVTREFWVQVDNPKMDTYRQTGPTWRLADATQHQMHRSPWFGEHNEELLAEVGLDAAERTELTEAGIIATAPVNPGVG
ncbi:MAG: crotonobetainyl-CoA:carnitine CoA-transferase CaiB-like acyl-CoA transferase [Candidatus Poriferisodalaceae bacterium]|jgi:crotonobetainyl-CoA:carnitine CoA-transferase CaiB-like acyl-CoA transferase